MILATTYYERIFPIKIIRADGSDMASTTVLIPGTAISTLSKLFFEDESSVIYPGGNTFVIRDEGYDFSESELVSSVKGVPGRISSINVLDNLYRMYYTVARDFIKFKYVTNDSFSIEPLENKSILISHKYVVDDDSENFGVTFRILREQLVFAQRQKFLLTGQYLINSTTADDGFFFVYPSQTDLQSLK